MAQYWQCEVEHPIPDWTMGLLHTSELLDQWGNHLRTINAVYEVTRTIPLEEALPLKTLAEKLGIPVP